MELIEFPAYDNRPENMYRITVENLMAGDKHELLFHPGPRLNNFSVDVNGNPWRVCGWSDAMNRIRKSCKRMSL